MGKRTALVTGASAGLGQSFARLLARDGMDLVITARREDRLASLKSEIEAAHGARVLTVTADLAEPTTPIRIRDEVLAAGIEIDMLVNNAGYGVAGHLAAVPWEEHERFIRVMVMAVCHMTHTFTPGMVDRGYGRIINVASLAGLVPGAPGHTLYGPAKAFLIKMSEALALELAGSGVYVTASCPGFTYTEFHDVLGNREQVGKLPKYMWMDADDVVRGAIDAVMRGDVLHVPGGFNKTVATITKLLPSAIVRRMSARHGGRVRKQTAS